MAIDVRRNYATAASAPTRVTEIQQTAGHDEPP